MDINMTINFVDIPVVIMAGGKGMRMRPYSDILPKPLLGYNGKTMLENVVDNYYRLGFYHFYLVLGYKGNLIQTYMESLNLPIDIHYIYEDIPLGTVGGLCYLKGIFNSSFLLCNCDNLGKFDYRSAFNSHFLNNADITIFAKKQHYCIPFGIIQCETNCIVTGIQEKPYYDFFASMGIHIINPAVLDILKGDIHMDMPELINKIAEKGRVIVEDVGDSEWTDMSIP